MKATYIFITLLIAFASKAMDQHQSANQALLEAATTGNLDRAKEALNDGAHVSFRNPQGATPLHFAAVNGHLPLVQFLLDHGADLTATTRLERDTPLHAAVTNGHLAIVKLLIDRGANVNARSRFGVTPLHLAAKSMARASIIQLLLDHGADLTAKIYKKIKTHGGDTPFLMALHSGGDVDSIELLITHGADLFITDRQGLTALALLNRRHFYENYPLLRAIIAFDHAEANLYLRIYHQGKRPTQSDINEIARALPLAAALRQTPLVEKILQAFGTRLPQSALHNALVASASHGHIPLVQLLVDRLPSLLSEDLITAIVEDAVYWAALNRQLNMLDYLLRWAFVDEHAPALNLTRAGQAIASLLETRTDLPEDKRQKLITIRELLAHVPRLRVAAGKEGISSIISALAQKITPALPPELFALILAWLLHPAGEKHFKST